VVQLVPRMHPMHQRRASLSVRFAVASIVEPPSRTCASEDSVLSWVTISDNLSLIESRRASRAESHAGACDRLMERRVENAFRMRRRRRNGKRKESRLKLLSLPLSPPSLPPSRRPLVSRGRVLREMDAWWMRGKTELTRSARLSASPAIYGATRSSPGREIAEVAI